MLAVGSFLYASSLSLVAAGPWPVVIAGAVLWGFAAGFSNGAVNIYSTLRMSGGAMQVLHGCWGIGPLLGPLLVTALLVTHHSWRLALVTMAVLQALLGLWALASAQWPSLSRPAHEAGQRLRLSSPLLLGILAFFLYTGAEWSVGQWAYTVLTENRGYPIAVAGLLVSLYWTGITVGRLAGGAVGLRLATRLPLLGGIGLAVLASRLFWLVPALSA